MTTLDPVGLAAAEKAVQEWLEWCDKNDEAPEQFSGARVSVSAYLAAVAEPIAWQWRQFHSGKWWNWNDCWDASSMSSRHEYWRDLASKMPNEVQVRPLFAAPIPVSITDEMVERAARAIHTRKYGPWYDGHLNMTDSQRECLADARAALEAAHTGGVRP